MALERTDLLPPIERLEARLRRSMQESLEARTNLLNKIHELTSDNFVNRDQISENLEAIQAAAAEAVDHHQDTVIRAEELEALCALRSEEATAKR